MHVLSETWVMMCAPSERGNLKLKAYSDLVDSACDVGHTKGNKIDGLCS